MGKCVWLGTAREANEVIIGTKDGVTRCYAVKRMTEEDRWNAEEITAKPFFVESKRVKCMLGAEESFADLRGYCDSNSILQYRLDEEIALVSISQCSRVDSTAAPGADSPIPLLTIDYMKKISESDVVRVAANLQEEAALLLFQTETQCSRPQSSLESPDAKRARTLNQQPTTPTHE